MLITFAFFVCEFACAVISPKTDRATSSIGIASHTLIAFSLAVSVALGAHGVTLSAIVPAAAARVSLTLIAAVLAMAASLFEGWRFREGNEFRIRWYKIMALAAATFAVYVAAQ